MPINPTRLHEDGTLDGFCEVGAHAFTIHRDDCDFARGLDGQPNLAYLFIRCPVATCPAEFTAHPAVGDANVREIIQQLFAARLLAGAEHPAAMPEEACAALYDLVVATGGPEYWQLGPIPPATDRQRMRDALAAQRARDAGRQP